MSGHNKWASIKHKKMATDAKRGKMFTKIIREIMMAAKMGGGNPENNPHLRIAIERARGINMPNDNIQRAIKKGTGEDGTVSLESVGYEGYGPGGIAVLVETLTDNKRRTAAEIRSIFSRHNGNLGESGCVSWMFERKGVIDVKKENVNEEQLFSLVLDAGADDLQLDNDVFEIVCPPDKVETIKKILEQNNIAIESASVNLIPKNTVRVEGKDAEQLLKLLDELEEHEDVQNVHSNFDIPDDVIEAMSK
ncbi:MAG TPA: YebC/PmpR family DNA-binding transcriptional regulator [Candidatus Ratteibacteria bacterium]|jgi:YebC/PmpR family DNA-binding regulatory protein|uniref:Probable transcriptional regulatory protein BWX89_00690 n=1 Tax=candidate division TA06 bacterium ADurb.Bin131 TaxID=1852827 RepID=A0A1V6CAW0_UNCT6|nr:MAG: putative transcriptional regulatory protein [candidate division TA06 bacterium ADurb.Bin131]HOC02177.1 YebC/PmpR family DNA-binding transcriptional regulator [bacterium]HON05908.1 YebC/PmpR family DNA-binding transcriptional regulator [bacterium]HRS06372.1 YebC/PmpR family DNA-binding transcriptional regulator [Candidatus Ratteibacteria bacterium]HRV04632.1 YebC/PmpR family DNA-binding transcriptional regulator [Candidatus Ratteibacteria bacterium]